MTERAKVQAQRIYESEGRVSVGSSFVRHHRAHLGQSVDLHIEQSRLGTRLTRVHDGPSLPSSVDDDADRAARCQHRIRPQHVLGGKRLDGVRDLHFGSVFGVGCRECGGEGTEGEGADEGVDVLRRRVGVDVSFNLEEVGVRGKALRPLNSDAKLPIGLSVELVGPDEASARGIRRAKEEHIGGDALVLLEEEHIADFDLAGRNGTKRCVGSGCAALLGVEVVGVGVEGRGGRIEEEVAGRVG